MPAGAYELDTLINVESGMADKQSESTEQKEDTINETETQEAAVTEPEAAGDAHAELTALLEDARAKADDHWNQLLRTRADMENLRRRAERDVENAHKYALERFVQELLPIRDSMELGLAAVSGDVPELAKFREGSELTLKMLDAALEKFGVQELNPVGEKFDPERHQAMSMQESADLEPNTVMAVVQKGFMLNERLIRPAMVIVSKTAASPDKVKIDETA